ncbi:MAG: hypothetical protein ACODUE_12345 [Synechococcus sp.]
MQAPQPWVTLTDLGRRYGLSAVGCGRLLSEAGLRDADGLPNERAVAEGVAFRRPEANANRSSLWHAERCGRLIEDRGIKPLDDSRLVQQWAELLAALAEGSEAISTTPDQMAEDLPGHLVPAVNDRLQLLGVDYRLPALRTAESGSCDSRIASSRTSHTRGKTPSPRHRGSAG